MNTTPISYSRAAADEQRAIARHAVRILAASALMFGLGWSAVAAQPAPPGHNVPPVPQSLVVPAGHEVFLAGHAIGTQNYICMPAGSSVTWRFLGPQATLFRSRAGDLWQQLTTHFLSANPAEMTARPTWQHSLDSSRVWGRVRASSNDPSFVESGAIDWLLVETAGVDVGPIGGGVLAHTTFIHRLNTSGGIAPATGCSDVSQVGTLALVPYSTDYFFYRASRGR